MRLNQGSRRKKKSKIGYEAKFSKKEASRTHLKVSWTMHIDLFTSRAKNLMKYTNLRINTFHVFRTIVAVIAIVRVAVAILSQNSSVINLFIQKLT